MRLKPSAVTLPGLLVLCSGLAHATFVVPAYSGSYDGVSNLNSVTLTLASTVAFPSSAATISVEDVRGTAAIVDLPASFAFLYSGAAALPNSLLLGLNGVLSQEVLLSFDLMPADLGFGVPFYTGDVIAAAIGVPVGTVTDPALTPFVGITFFDFAYQPNSSNPSAGLLTYGLSGILPSATEVPEPSPVVFCWGGSVVLLMGFCKRKGQVCR